jgi:hypothetical protein
MAGRRQRMSPLDAALVRLADLAGRGVQPARMAREVEMIVAGWVGGAEAVDPDEVCERLTGLHEQLVAGTADAEEQLADVDRSDAGAVRHAGLVHAALAAAVDAVERARDALQGAAAPAPRLPEVPREPVMAASASPAPAVTIELLATRNPLEVVSPHAEEVNAEAVSVAVPEATKPTTTVPKGRRKRRTAQAEENSLQGLLA